MLASASFDFFIKIWALKKLVSNKYELILLYSEQGTGSQNCLDWAQARFPLLATVSSDGVLTIIMKEMGKWVFLKEATRNDTILTAVCWAPRTLRFFMKDGADPYYFAVVGCDHKMIISHFSPEAKRVQVVRSLEVCHSGWIRDVSWSPASFLNHALIATGSEDNSCKIWRIDLDKNEHSSQTLELTSPVWRVKWNFVGNLLAVGYTSNEGANAVTIYAQGDDGVWSKYTQIKPDTSH